MYGYTVRYVDNATGESITKTKTNVSAEDVGATLKSYTDAVTAASVKLVQFVVVPYVAPVAPVAPAAAVK